MRALITGAANWIGGALARELLADPETELVVALDTRAPELPVDGRAIHVEADIRSPDLPRLLAPHAPDVVVHNEVLQFPEPDRSGRLLHDINVVGTLQLLAACSGMPSLRTLVVRSSAAIYGSEPDAPAFFTEEMTRRYPLRTRWQRDVSELETLVDGHARRHPGVVCTILRPQPIIGPGLDTPIMRLLRSRVIPTWPGFDPRIQVIGGDDLVSALARAAREPVRGAVNVAADGTVSLSRMLRRLRRIALPLGPLGLRGAGPDVARYLRYGRGVDTTRMREQLRFQPRLSTIEAIEATAEAFA